MDNLSHSIAFACAKIISKNIRMPRYIVRKIVIPSITRLTTTCQWEEIINGLIKNTKQSKEET